MQDEIVQVANETVQLYWEEVEEGSQSDVGLQEYVDKAISKKKEELFTAFNKASSIANPAFGPAFMEQVSVINFDILKRLLSVHGMSIESL